MVLPEFIYEKTVLTAFLFLHLRLDSHRGMGDNHQSFLGDKLASNATDAVGLILNAHQSGIEVFDKLLLTGGETRVLLFG